MVRSRSCSPNLTPTFVLLEIFRHGVIQHDRLCAQPRGQPGRILFEWELKSVNAKGFDLRARCRRAGTRSSAHPQSAPPRRCRAVRSTPTCRSSAPIAAPSVRINEEVLGAGDEGRARSCAGSTPPPTVDGLLAIKGVIEVVEPEDNEDDGEAAEGRRRRGLRAGADGLVEMRRREGTELGAS